MTASTHPSLEDSAAIAANAHAGQVDQAGRPYFTHLARVAAGLVTRFPEATLAERHAAWLHDVLEDTDVTAQSLAALGYAPEVITLVRALTRDRRVDYATWIAALGEGPIGAVRVKRADLADNMDPARLQLLPQARARSLRTRYIAPASHLDEVLARHGAVDATDDRPRLDQTVRVTLDLSEPDYWALAYAADLAGRNPAGFAEEEALWLAHKIAATGHLTHVRLARDERAEAHTLIDAIRKAGPSDAALQDWVRRQRRPYDGDRD